jgi:hypothetical protein
MHNKHGSSALKDSLLHRRMIVTCNNAQDIIVWLVISTSKCSEVTRSYAMIAANKISSCDIYLFIDNVYQPT